jgi:hypothetical protein
VLVEGAEHQHPVGFAGLLDHHWRDLGPPAQSAEAILGLCGGDAHGAIRIERNDHLGQVEFFH